MNHYPIILQQPIVCVGAKESELTDYLKLTPKINDSSFAGMMYNMNSRLRCGSWVGVGTFKQKLLSKMWLAGFFSSLRSNREWRGSLCECR